MSPLWRKRAALHGPSILDVSCSHPGTSVRGLSANLATKVLVKKTDNETDAIF